MFAIRLNGKVDKKRGKLKAVANTIAYIVANTIAYKWSIFLSVLSGVLSSGNLTETIFIFCVIIDVEIEFGYILKDKVKHLAWEYYSLNLR